MEMRAEAKDDWTFEEPTVAEEEREASARQNMAWAVAEQVRASAPVNAVLVVARGTGMPTAVLVDDTRRHSRELDNVVLAEILAAAGDDQMVLALARLFLGDCEDVEHTVARDRDGAITGVIAVRISGRVSSSWLRTVLARAANSLTGWLAVDVTWPPQSLLEAIDEPALAHEGGIVLVANQPLARMLGREPNEVIGMPVSRITRRLAVHRACSLVVGGRARPALLFDPPHAPPAGTSLLGCLERVLADRYTLLRRTTRVSIERRDQAEVAVPAPALEALVSIALLDATAMFVIPAQANHVKCWIYREDTMWVVLELIATGSLFHRPDTEHLGAVVCATRTRELGGQFLSDTSRHDARVIRIKLPVAS
ncbi:MAG TPA: hypothetical protein VFV99_13095 [Kofleriaceae bacterium]|nr:hypothetical protein [Kofleriaceae bacterium]